MAQTLKITDGTTEIDFLASTLFAVGEGWQSAESGLEPVWETFDLAGNITDANLRTAQSNLEKLFRQARRYIDNPVENNPVWLYFSSEGESAKRALVLDGSSRISASGRSSPLLGAGGTLMSLAIKRAPFYENTSGTAIANSGVSTLGGSWAVGSASGDVDSRISELKVTTSATVVTLTELWVGLRDVRNGTTGFISVWEAEAGVNDVDAADAADAGASGGNRVTISFATVAGMAQRFSVRWFDVQTVGNWDDLAGDYLVLGRFKLDAITTEVRMQLRSGWAGSTLGADVVSDVYFSAVDDNTLTNYQLHPLGRVSIPPTGNRDGVMNTNLKNYMMQIHAERLSGSGALHFDCLALVPAERLAYINYGNINAASGGYVGMYSGPDDLEYAVMNTATAGLIGQVEFLLENWGYPVGGGLLVVAAQENGSHTLNKTVDLAGTIYPRWRLYRTS